MTQKKSWEPTGSRTQVNTWRTFLRPAAGPQPCLQKWLALAFAMWRL